MANPEILSEEPISMLELKQEVNKIKKRDKELGFRIAKVEEYLNKYVKLKVKDYKDLENEIEKLNVPRLKDIHIKKIIDLLPATLDQLKVILQGYSVTVNQDNMKKIVAVVKKYIPE